MRPLVLVSTINSRHWNANRTYLQLLSVQRCQHPPQAERCCWGGEGVGHAFSTGGVPSSVRPLLCVRLARLFHCKDQARSVGEVSRENTRASENPYRRPCPAHAAASERAARRSAMPRMRNGPERI